MTPTTTTETDINSLGYAGSFPPAFKPFSKIPRLVRDCIVTEKLDGTNAQVFISESGEVIAGSRNRWITPAADNYGFARWVEGNKNELLKLGPGAHFGEWWGLGIQRGYDLHERRFSLFNVSKWAAKEARPACCSVVPMLWQGIFNTETINIILWRLRQNGSFAAPGYINPEGIVIFHTAAGHLYKRTLENDESPKSIAP
jgi:hypothetical protein